MDEEEETDDSHIFRADHTDKSSPLSSVIGSCLVQSYDEQVKEPHKSTRFTSPGLCATKAGSHVCESSEHSYSEWVQPGGKSVRFEESHLNNKAESVNPNNPLSQHASPKAFTSDSAYQGLYLEFKSNWKILCTHYDKLKLTDRGVTYAKEGDFKKALLTFEIAASEGCPKATFNLGLMYVTGTGCTTDMEKAAGLYEKAAKLGSVEAAHNLALLLLSKPHKSDNTRAIELLEKSSAGGLAASKVELAVLRVKNGEYGRVVSLLKEAAMQQDADALYLLGVCYEDGIGVQQDQMKAIDLYNRALDRGNTHAKDGLLRLEESDSSGSDDMGC